MNHSIIELFARGLIFCLSNRRGDNANARCTQRSDRSCKVIYYEFARKIKGIRGGWRNTWVPRGMLPVRRVAMFYPARTPENAVVRPASPCLARALRARSAGTIDREATATFPVRVMRSKLGEKQRTQRTLRRTSFRRGDARRRDRSYRRKRKKQNG